MSKVVRRTRLVRIPIPDAGGLIDHRSIVGHQRRKRTELKILQAALAVFTEKAPDTPVIDDFIKAANIARGTFYNYFKSTEELRQAVSDWLTDDVVAAIDAEVRLIKDPVRRLGTALRLWINIAESDREWCAFVARVLFMSDYGTLRTLRDVRAGLRTGAFNCPSVAAAVDLVSGTLQHAMLRLVSEPDLKNYGDAVTRTMLQGLGTERKRIDEVMNAALPDIPKPPSSRSR